MARTYKVGPDVDLDKEVILDTKGCRITEKRAKDIAEKTLEKIGRGRPSLTGARVRLPATCSEHPLSCEPKQRRVRRAKAKRSHNWRGEALDRLLAG